MVASGSAPAAGFSRTVRSARAATSSLLAVSGGASSSSIEGDEGLRAGERSRDECTVGPMGEAWVPPVGAMLGARGDLSNPCFRVSVMSDLSGRCRSGRTDG
jgi:hypothetical protein